MHTFTKAQIASLIATGIDLAVAFLLLKWTTPPAPAVSSSAMVAFCGATGTLCGGATHFMISRTWVFGKRETKWTAQINRYALVWIGNLILNASILFLLAHYTQMDHRLAKVITSLVVAVCYNYILQKRFVFKH